MLYSWDVLALGCIDPVSVWWSELDADSTRKIMTDDASQVVFEQSSSSSLLIATDAKQDRKHKVLL